MFEVFYLAKPLFRLFLGFVRPPQITLRLFGEYEISCFPFDDHRPLSIISLTGEYAARFSVLHLFDIGFGDILQFYAKLDG